MKIFELIKNIEEEVADSISDLECFQQLLETEDQRFKSSIQVFPLCVCWKVYLGTGIKDQSIMDTLPLDLLYEVFSRLPANHLMRLTPMCNEWQISISSLCFVKQHLLLSINNNTHSDKLIFSTHMDGSRIVRICDVYKLFEKFESDVQVGYEPIQPPDCLQFVGSCDGLLCIIGSCNLIIWNPIIRT
ncbi:putative F-box domain-containing protein [Helianthus debilis subsp. tardiflorus]